MSGSFRNDCVRFLDHSPRVFTHDFCYICEKRINMITIEINERTKAGKALLEVARLFSKEEKGVKIIEESPYDKNFVKKIKARERSASGAKLTRLNPDNVWENL